MPERPEKTSWKGNGLKDMKRGAMGMSAGKHCQQSKPQRTSEEVRRLRAKLMLGENSAVHGSGVEAEKQWGHVRHKEGQGSQNQGHGVLTAV